MTREELDTVAKQTVDACYSVHKAMGPGLLESVYEACLIKEFELRKINAKSQVLVPLKYKGHELMKEFRMDILVESEIILEIKSAEHMIPV